jgi:hypothetical protein
MTRGKRSAPGGGRVFGEMMRGEDVWLAAKNFYHSFLALSAVGQLKVPTIVLTIVT